MPHRTRARRLLTDKCETIQWSPTDTEKDTCGGICLKTISYVQIKLKSLSAEDPPPATQALSQIQTQQWKAWIIDPTGPLRVHSAPWCNSPEDAWEERQHLSNVLKVSKKCNPQIPWCNSARFVRSCLPDYYYYYFLLSSSVQGETVHSNPAAVSLLLY